MKVHVVYDTQHGNTRTAAEKIAEGARLEGATAVTLDVEETNPYAAAACDMLIIGAPTHFGGPSRTMLKFIEELRKAGVHGKTGAVFATHMKGDGGKTLETIVQKLTEKRFKKDEGMKLVLDGLVVDAGEIQGPLSEAELAKCVEFGKRAAAPKS